MRFTITSYKCPHCKKTISRTLNEMDPQIGQPHFIKCQYCGKAINSGYKEWDNLTSLDKSETYFSVIFHNLVFFTFLPFGMTLGLAFLLEYLTYNLNVFRWSILLVLFIIAFILSICLFHITVWKPLKTSINDSKKRTGNRL